MHEDHEIAHALLPRLHDLAVRLGMLPANIKTKYRITARASRSFGGREKDMAYLSLNLGRKPDPDYDALIANWRKYKPNAHSRINSLEFARKYKAMGYRVFTEYPSFSDDPVIGNYAGSATGCVAVLLAHEMAHVVNYCTTDSRFKGRSHNEGFKYVYRILRTEFLREIEEQPVEVMPVQRAASNRSGEGKPPKKKTGAVADVWRICRENPEASRATILHLCDMEFINPNTAKTQYYHWNKAGRPAEE